MAQNLTTNIVINARTGNGFSQVGNTLTELGNIVNGISQRLISFGDDSLKVYRDYEKSMASAEVALSTTYGRGTQQLSRVMSQLDASATEWAATTIFHTNDVGNAISEAAHAGWDYEQIMVGLPAAMRLAQAGGLDLSEAVNYIVKSTYAAGVEFEDLSSFIDLWTFAANSSASTIGEFGDAMLRMGSTMRFTDNTAELMTLLAVTANAGSVGSEAGTMVRNSLIRLLAPTKKANAAMKSLGATSEETAEALSDERLIEANKRLEEFGFTAYDQQGNLRSILDIYNDLYVALGGVAGGFENIEGNKDAVAILSAIFPTRTITEALNLLRAAANEYDGLYDAMQSGAAEGYGAYAAATMMDTLDGSIETFNSKLERLKQLVGGELKEQAVDLADWAGGLVDSLAEMDPDKFSALVHGLEVIAGAGPALLTLGAGFRLLGFLSTPAGAAAATVLALGTALAYLGDMAEADYANLFGNMQLDTAALNQGIFEMGAGFREAHQEIDAFSDALEKSVVAYETASGDLSGKLLTNMLTGGKLTAEDRKAIYSLANDMHTALSDAIRDSTGRSTSFWSMLFEGEESSQAYKDILGLVNSGAEEATQEAERISRQLRMALTSAMADGEISDEEYENILNYMRSYNDAMARAAAEARNEDEFVEMQKLLHKAQTASPEEIEGIAQQMAEQRDSALATLEDEYLSERYRLEYRHQQGNLSKEQFTDDMKDADERYQAAVDRINTQYAQPLMGLYGTQLRQSDMADNNEWLEGLTEQLVAGGMSEEDARAAVNRQFPLTQMMDRANLERYYTSWISSMGGREAIETQIAAYEQQGNAAMAGQLRSLLTTADLVHDYGSIPLTPQPGMNPLAAADAGGAAIAPEAFPAAGRFCRWLGGLFDFSMVPAPGMPAGAFAASAGIPAADASAVTAPVEGDTTQLAADIEAENGHEVTASVDGDTSALDSAIESRNGRSIFTNVFEHVTGMPMFAEGGRTTTPSICGDDGAEWAIPEEHSEKTAALLNAARAASGFSWVELLERYGGLNADAGHTPATVIYSPTVYAQNAEGVDSVLREDKKRLDKWFRERELRDATELYA